LLADISSNFRGRNIGQQTDNKTLGNPGQRYMSLLAFFSVYRAEQNWGHGVAHHIHTLATWLPEVPDEEGTNGLIIFDGRGNSLSSPQGAKGTFA
jgi:hypothetical protein